MDNDPLNTQPNQPETEEPKVPEIPEEPTLEAAPEAEEPKSSEVPEEPVLETTPETPLAEPTLTTVPEEPEEAKEEEKETFLSMKALYDSLKEEFHFDTLSMGMSADYVEALKAGSTMVRVGSKIFGARTYTH